MEHLETTALATYWAEVKKFEARRGAAFRAQKDLGLVVTFRRLGNYVLCEIYSRLDVEDRRRLAVGISHKSHACYGCGIPGDKWNEKTGKTLALWSALRDLTGAARAKQ